MAIRAPLVIINGKIQELPVGDYIAGAPPGPQGPPGSGIPDSTAIVAEDISPGQAIYLDGSGELRLAQADSEMTGYAAGICTVGATAGNAASYVTEGLVALANWTVSVGTASLTPGTLYFLDPNNPGGMTEVSPTSSGQIVLVTGRATTGQILDLIFTQPVLL